MNISDSNITQDYLLKVHTYLSRNYFNKNGYHVVKNNILQLLLKQNVNLVVKRDQTCPYCFTYWREGNYTLKVKSKKEYNKKNKKSSLKATVLKCSICNKYTSFEGVSLENSFSLVKKPTSKTKRNNNDTRKQKTNTDKKVNPIEKQKLDLLNGRKMKTGTHLHNTTVNNKPKGKRLQKQRNSVFTISSKILTQKSLLDELLS